MARGNGKMPIFLDDQDHRRFVFFLGDVVEEFEIECWNYCVMPNHYHATIRPHRPNVSMAMRKLNSRYAQWWNHRHERVGHVFQGRFKDQIVQEDRYALALTRYVARNPMRAGLVERPEDWRWSSYGSTAGIVTVPSFLAISPTLRMFGDADEEVLKRRFMEFVIGDASDEADSDRIRSAERIIGTAAFKLEIRCKTELESEGSQNEKRGNEFGATFQLEERSSA
jgi:REP element-mobilizing transposase RayT